MLFSLIILPSLVAAFRMGAASIQRSNAIHGPLTAHFTQWLNDNGYDGDDFSRLDYGDQGSYGGKQAAGDVITNTPVIFIHGNSDAALAPGPTFLGWTNSIQYFLDQGWNSGSLYATSWGDDDPANAPIRTNDCNTTQRLRRFIVAVKNYTGAEKVHLITHSMGVTLGRKAVLGGQITASDGDCHVGVPLRYVDVFIGMSGANYGLCSCIEDLVLTPGCNHENGFWPGDFCGDNHADQCGAAVMNTPCDGVKYAKLLSDLNADFQQLAKRVVSAWSTADDAILYGDNIWGRPTSLIPRSTDKKIYANYTHMETKESPESVKNQYEWVNRII